MSLNKEIYNVNEIYSSSIKAKNVCNYFLGANLYSYNKSLLIKNTKVYISLNKLTYRFKFLPVARAASVVENTSILENILFSRPRFKSIDSE